MEQTLPLRKAALPPRMALGAAAILSLVGCAGGSRLAEAPVVAPVSPARAASLRSSGYDAPDVARRAPARMIPASYAAPSGPSAPSPAPKRAEALSPYFTPEAPEEGADAETPSVPAPRPAAYAAPARAPLPDLDAIVVTDDRAPIDRAPIRTAQVFEGETRSVMPDREASRAPSPSAADTPTEAPAARPAPVPAAPAPAPAPTLGTASASAALHLASYRQTSQAEAGWGVLTRDHGAVLAGLSPALARVDVPGRGEFVRLIAGPLDAGQAKTACAALETQGAYCAVTDWSADTF